MFKLDFKKKSFYNLFYLNINNHYLDNDEVLLYFNQYFNKDMYCSQESLC